jgi:hypothetical protein
VIIASLSVSLVFMLLMALVSVFVLCVCEGSLFSRALMRSRANFLYTSRFEGGRCDMAVSASSAKFWIQFFGFRVQIVFFVVVLLCF